MARKNIFVILLMLTSLLLGATIAQSAVVFVSKNGDGSDGLTWTKAKTTIQAGIDIASPGDEVWVAAGIYEEVITNASAQLYGGFAGNEISRDQRNWKTNLTIIDGANLPDFGPNLVYIPSSGSPGATPVVDGFTIKRGFIGIICDHSWPIISNNIISDNGFMGIGSSYAGMTVVGNEIINNGHRPPDANRGFGIHVKCQDVKIANNILSGNGSNYGAAICIVSSDASITNNTIINNVESNSDIYGVHINVVPDGVPVLRNNIIAYNGGGIYLRRDGSAPLHLPGGGNDVYGNQDIDGNNLDYVGTGIPGNVLFQSGANISTDPLFTVGYHLKIGSPCIDAGDSGTYIWPLDLPVTDKDGCTRPQDGNADGSWLYDIGAFEFPAPSDISIGAVRNAPTNVNVTLVEKSVISVFDGGFYIEEQDRSAGLRVSWPSTNITVGATVAVYGTMSETSSGEQVLNAISVTIDGNAPVPSPLAITQRWLGGKGIQGASGWNNIGVLVKLYGKVTHTSAGSFYIDDGSTITDGSGNIGIKVSASGMLLPSLGSSVQVSGISSCFKTGNEVHRLLLVRGQNDIVSIPSFATVSTTLNSGPNLIAPPLFPLDPTPTSVFTGININGQLTRYDSLLGNIDYFDWTWQDPGSYGYVLLGDGAWLNLEQQATWSYIGIPDGLPDITGVMTDVYVALPHAGASLIGHPFNHAVSLAGCKVTDGIRTLNFSDAINNDWIGPLLTGYDPNSGYFDVGIEDWYEHQTIEPWHGYWVYVNRNNLGLIVTAN